MSSDLVIGIVSFIFCILLSIAVVRSAHKSTLKKLKKQKENILQEYIKIGIFDPVRIDFFDNKKQSLLI